MGELRVASLPHGAHRTYLRKAEEFAATMTSALEEGRLNSAGLAAVHCVISACDALSAFHLGKRSRGRDHFEALHLLDQAHLPGWKERVPQIAEVLAMKNAVEYEAREPRKEDVVRVVAQAGRVLRWARSTLREA